MSNILIILVLCGMVILICQQKQLGQHPHRHKWLLMRSLILVGLIVPVFFPSIPGPKTEVRHVLLMDSSASMKAYKDTCLEMVAMFNEEHKGEDALVFMFDEKIQAFNAKAFGLGQMTDLTTAYAYLEARYKDQPLSIHLVTDGYITELVPQAHEIPKHWQIQTNPLIGQKKKMLLWITFVSLGFHLMT